MKNQQQIAQANQQPQQAGNERTPLLNSIGAAAESLVNNSVVGGDIQQGVSWGIAGLLLVNTALGAGMLNYPYAYNQIGGLWTAALMQIVLLVFISSTMFILIYCADFNHDDTYQDVLLSMCGRRAQQISALSILLTCYGINITFLVIIGDQYDRIFDSLMPGYSEEFWYLNRKFTIFITSILFIWPMCYAQRLDFLRYASILGMFAMLYVAFLTVYEHYVLDEATIAAVKAKSATINNNGTQSALNQTTTTTTTTTTENNKNALMTWFEPLAIVPVLCFAYQTHEIIVPVYACMRERFIATFMKATFFGLIILFLLYNLVGAFGYLTFGADVGPDIMSLYDGKDPIVVVGIVALVIKFVTTYPPLMFCGRSALDGLYGELRQLTPTEFKKNEKSRRIVTSTAWFLSTVLLSIFAPDISVTLQLLGSMASINVFVFPGMCLVSLTYRIRRARHALLMGELPPSASDCQQRANDYHLISGSYFSAAMKRRKSLLQQQRQQLMSNNDRQQDNNSLRNQLLSNSGSIGPQQGQQQQCNGLNTTKVDSCANYSADNNLANDSDTSKHFTATFANLIEFENNLVTSTCSNDDQILHREHNSLLLKGQNNYCRQSRTTNIRLGTGVPTTSSSSNSSSNGFQLSTSTMGNKFQQNGYGATNNSPIKANGHAYHDTNVLQRQNERLMTNGQQTNDDGRLSTSGKCCCCIDTNPSSVKTQSNANDERPRKSPALDSFSSSLGQFKEGYQKLYAAPVQATTTNHQLTMNSCDKRSSTPPPSSSTEDNQQDSYLHTDNSLLNKFGSSIAPSTVAQIGISRCAAISLYSFAGLLIAFGTFIFVLELVNVIARWL